MKKLTLSADPEVIEQAKRLAKETGTSVSSLFERFVRVLARKRAPQRIGRLTRKASGLVTMPRGKSEREVLADALVDKYRIKQ
jgi:hypothetical protein